MAAGTIFEEVPYVELRAGDLFQIVGDLPMELNYGRVVADADPATGGIEYSCQERTYTCTPFEPTQTVTVLRGPAR